MSGNDSNPGTQALPWKSIQNCLNQVQPGDACEIFGGVYSEALVLKTSGTQSARITIKNYNNQNVTVNSSGKKSLVTTGKIEYYTIKGLTFIANDVSPNVEDYSLDFKNELWDGETNKDGGNNGFIIRNCYVEGSIKFYGHNNLVEDCELNGKNNWSNGIHDQFATSHDNIYRSNFIHDYKQRGIWTMQYTDNIIIESNIINNIGEIGIDCDGAGNPVTRCFVKNNIIHNITGEGVGILLENAFDSIVEANKIYLINQGISSINYGPTISQVEYRSTDTHTIIRNNLIFDAANDGIICKASPGGKALNNTIFNTRQISGYWAAIGLARYGGYYCHNWEIRNNIISQADKYAIWYDSPPGGLINLTADYNLFDFSPIETQFVWSVYTGTGEHWDYYTLAQMQSQKQLEQHSIVGKPNFLNPSQQDFHLQFGSPAIDMGTNVETFADFDGNAVPQGKAFDIGAFEFIAQPQTSEASTILK